MPALRRLNTAGIKAFRQFLADIRAGAEFQQSPAVLYADTTSERIPPDVRIEAKRFRRKLDAAQYLHEVLRPLQSASLMLDEGLWSWLALFYFDQLSPLGADAKRRPREDYHYIPAKSGYQSDRHLLSGPYKLYALHGVRARLLLHPPVHQHGRFVFDLGWRRELILNRGLIEAIDLLYWNEKSRRPKRGATTGSKPGNLRRFIAVIQQLDFNYDLFGMTGPEILDLLPGEFEAWMPVQRELRA
jgi:hypothetical protein